jgi:tetratricopeptide (TPR) repeat protein
MMPGSMRGICLCVLLAGVAMAEELPEFDKLWDYHKPAETEKKFREILPQAEKSGDLDYHLQLLTQIARTLGLQGKFDEAHKLLDEIESKLTEKTKTARIRYLLERGRAFNSSKKVDKARPLFVEAWEFGNEHGEDLHAVDAAHMMALVEPPEKKLAWNLKAMDLAEKSKDPRAKRWLGTLYNNIGWDYHDQKEYKKALEALEKCWAWYKQYAPHSRGALIAKWSVAKQLRYLDRVDQALEMQRELHDVYEKLGEPDGFVFEELGECLLLKGQADEAKPWFKKAYAELRKIGWVKESYPERWARLRRLAEEDE